MFERVDDSDLDRVLDDCARVVERPGECDHAIGHAFVRAQERRDAADALVRCQRLALDDGADGALRVHDCQHGAVKEDALLDAGDDDVDIDECEAIEDGLARRNCSEFLAARALLLGDTWKEAAQRCEALDDQVDLDACRRGWIDAAPDRATCRLHPDADQRRDCRMRRR